MMTQDNAMDPRARKVLMRTQAQEQAYLKRMAAYYRCFSTLSGQIVLEDLKNLIPGKVSGKTELDTVRNAAVRDVLGIIIAQIDAGKNPAEIPLNVNPNEATQQGANDDR